MSDAGKVLGQVLPASGTLTTLYTVPGAGVRYAVVSSVSICNQSSSQTTVRLSIAVAGAADNAKQYLYYDAPVAGNDTIIATIGVTPATTDVLRVLSANGQVAFQAFGVEVT